jgi:hypothetical protein
MLHHSNLPFLLSKWTVSGLLLGVGWVCEVLEVVYEVCVALVGFVGVVGGHFGGEGPGRMKGVLRAIAEYCRDPSSFSR